jgi:hypothetical protein
MSRGGRILLVAAGAALALSACSTMGGKPRVLEVPPPARPAPVTPAKPPPPPPPPRVEPAPVAKSCVPKTLPPPPRYPDTDAALRNAAGAADRYQLLAAGRILREQRLDQLEAVVADCR